MALAAGSGTGTDRTRHCRRSLFSILVLGVFLSGWMTASAREREEDIGASSTSPASFTFEPYEVVIGSAKRQTVLTGFLLGGAMAELAVVSVDENDEYRLRIYGFDDGSWASRLDATLSPEVLFVDVARIGGRDRLITYERGRLNWFDPESATERPLVAVASSFTPSRRGEIPHVDVTRDLNGDGHDDLVVPDVDGFRVFIQVEGGTFAEPVRVGPSTEMAWIHETDGYRYDPWARGRVHEMDYDRDGRRDLVFWDEDHFEVHHQDERGLFASVSRAFTTEVAFDSDDLASLAAPDGVRRRRKDHQPTGSLTGRVLHSLRDMNGDGVTDLVVFSLKGGSLWSMHSAYEVYLGRPIPDGTVFARDFSTAIRSDGIPFGFEPHDFDHDGQIDVMFTTIDPGISMVIGMLVSWLLSESVSMDLEFYRMEGGSYPDRPSAGGKLKTTPGQSGERTLYAPLLIGDVNGDNRSDLLVGKGRNGLRVYLGAPGSELFARPPHRTAIDMPCEEYTWLADLNEDGKQDVVLHHPSATEPNRVTLLVAR